MTLSLLTLPELMPWPKIKYDDSSITNTKLIVLVMIPLIMIILSQWWNIYDVEFAYIIQFHLLDTPSQMPNSPYQIPSTYMFITLFSCTASIVAKFCTFWRKISFKRVVKSENYEVYTCWWYELTCQHCYISPAFNLVIIVGIIKFLNAWSGLILQCKLFFGG